MSQYVFDHALDLEQQRLEKLSEWLDPGTERLLDQIGLARGWRVLEVGAGAGSMVRVLSDRVGSAGSVLATDLDLKFLDGLNLPNVEVQKHDIVNDPLPEDTFDLVHTRLVVMHLPAREEALKRMVAAAKPGGWIFVEDMEFLTWIDVTPSEPMARVKAAMEKMFALAGADPTLGRKLPILLEGAGVENVWLEGRVAWGERWNSPGLQMFKLMLIELREFLVQTGAVSAEDVDAAIATIDDPEWVGMPPMIVAALGRKPA
jgi:SAM-dependent methyltransferase